MTARQREESEMTQQSGASSTGAIDIGSRLEPLIDDYLIDRMEGARLTLH